MSSIHAGQITTQREYTMWCGACMAFVDLYPMPNSQAQAIKDARELGWRYRKGIGWICPHCATTKETRS